MRYQFILAGILTLFVVVSKASISTILHVKSPDGKLDLKLENAEQLKWSLSDEGTAVIIPSAISLTISKNRSVPIL